MTMNLSQALRLIHPPALRDNSPNSKEVLGKQVWVALAGAGGKTTALFQLARELRPPVIVTATTHLHVDQIPLADSHWIGETPEDLAGLEKNLYGVMLVTGPLKGTRTTGLNNNTLSRLRAICGYQALPLLIEADGSRQRPLKAPAVHESPNFGGEPPIPDFVETVLVVAGLSGLGKPLTEEFVHRPGIFASLSGLTAGEAITPEALLRVLTNPAGGLKNIPSQARRIVILNQADTPELQAQAKALAENLLIAYQSVVIASLGQSQIHAVYEPVAGIILAGGEAKRFGQPKQLLDYRGQPFVRNVAQTALASGLSPVVVVSGANAQAVEAAVQDLPITIARNAEWEKGQSSSIQSGLRILPAQTGGTIFLLADQPQATTTVIRALIEQHRLSLSPIVAPQVAGRRTNPVLFDCVTFPDLMAQTGDVGGRAIFGKYPITYLPWHEENLLLDVDTPEDLERLRNRE
ncbi:MAG: selenium cofactor biosynthesis protein YqeC [Anaerolineales bacterium]|jgi:probable selenium-dependent hydroxylase accessory protein YqeC